MSDHVQEEGYKKKQIQIQTCSEHVGYSANSLAAKKVFEQNEQDWGSAYWALETTLNHVSFMLCIVGTLLGLSNRLTKRLGAQVEKIACEEPLPWLQGAMNSWS